MELIFGLIGLGFALAIWLGPSILYTRILDKRRRKEAEALDARVTNLTFRFDSLQKQVLELEKRSVQPDQKFSYGVSAPAGESAAPVRAFATDVPIQPAPKPVALPPEPKTEPKPEPSPLKELWPQIEKAVAVPPVVPPRTEPIAKPLVPPPPPMTQPPPVASSASVAKPAVPSPPTAPPKPVEVPPLAAAKTVAPQQTAPFRQPGTVPPVSRPPIQPAPQPAKRSSVSVETMIGTNWLPKLGVLIMFIGLVSWIASQWQSIPPFGRIGLFYLLSASMLALGIWLEKRDRFLVLGRSLIGGGWAITFFTTYAMHHVAASRILDSLEIDLLLMVIVAGAMVWHTLKYNSQLVTGLAFMLGFFSVTQSHESPFSLAAGVILAIGLVVLVQKRSWFELEIFGILASFLNHFYWLYPIIEPMQEKLGHNVMFPAYPYSVAVLVIYWIIFRTSYVIRQIDSPNEERISTVAALLNTFLLLGLMKYQSVRPELAFYALLVIGTVELSLGQLRNVKARRTAFLVLSTLGGCLLIGAFPFKFAGSPLALFWLIGAQAFLLSGVFAKEVLFRRFGMYTAVLATGYEAVTQGAPFLVALFENWGSPKHTDSTLSVLFAFTAAVLYLDAHWIGRKWSDLFESKLDSDTLYLLSLLGGTAAVVSVYAFIPQNWVAVSLAGFVCVVAFAGKRLEAPVLLLQAHSLAMLATVDLLASNSWSPSNVRIATFVSVAALLYLGSKIVRHSNDSESTDLTISQGYTWLGTGILAVLLYHQATEWKTAVAWITLALVAAVVGKRLDRNDFNWQALTLAGLAFLRSIAFNLEDTQSVGGMGISWRLISIVLVSATLYALSIWPPRADVRFIYSWAGTILVAALAFQEAPDLWVAVAWAVLALVMTFAARQFEKRHLLWQAHILSIMAVGRVLVANFDEPFRGTLQQLITVAIVAVSLYAIAKLARFTELVEAEYIPYFYSWAGSLLVTWLMWYQLRPIGVAIGWAIFGLIVFEIGSNIKSSSLQWQGYVAMAASFFRIFFVNLNAESVPGTLSPRVYTILPLVLIYFYVYWRLTADPDTESNTAGKFKVGALLSYFGSLAIFAIVRTELAAPWVIVGWAALATCLLVVAFSTKQSVFLHQAFIALGAVAFRATMYNFDPVIAERFSTVVTAVVVLLVGLPFAFLIRGHQEDASAMKKESLVLFRRPEQPFFFIPIGIFTVLLFLQLHGGSITLSWGVEGLVIFVLALFAKERSYRLTGLALLMACVLKILVYDIWTLQEAGMKAVGLIGVGAILTLVAFLYGKYREKLSEYL